MPDPTRDPRIVIFTDEPGWHGRSLCTAFEAQGLEALYCSLTDARLEMGPEGARICLPGFGSALPRGAFVRGVPGGLLESVILRLDVLHALALEGIPVFNSGRAIEKTVDKALTSHLLARAGLPTPRTWVCESRAAALACAQPEFDAGRELVMKPLFGSQGQGLRRLARSEDLLEAQAVGGVFYLQEFVGTPHPPFRDWRVMVIAGKARFAMCRESGHWITNRAQGAQCTAVELDEGARTLAETAAQCVEADYAGVDLLRDAHGHWLVGEVNGVPAWWGLTQATGKDVTAALVEAFCAMLTESA